MAKRRVHEIAKEHGLSSKELLEKLKAAGIEAKVAASSVEEALVAKALGIDGASSPPSPTGPPAAVAPAPAPAPPPPPAGEPPSPATSAPAAAAGAAPATE